jgi:hypothetical protein
VTRRLSRGGLAGAAVCIVLSAGVTAAVAARSASNPIPKGYTGVEAKLPTQYPAPVKKGRPARSGSRTRSRPTSS